MKPAGNQPSSTRARKKNQSTGETLDLRRTPSMRKAIASQEPNVTFVQRAARQERGPEWRGARIERQRSRRVHRSR